MTDLDQTADRLRAALDELVADVPAVRNQPALLHPATMVIEGRRWSRQRSLATITVAVVVATVVAAVVYYGPRSGPTGPTVSKQAGRHTGALASPPGWINLPFLLPTGNAIVDSAMVASGPVPVPSNGTYEQAYEGPQTTDSPQLLITTVQAQPGAIADYAAGSQAVSVNGGVAYLTSFQDHQLLWQTPDGVVVSLESKGMSSSDVVAAAQLVEPHPSSQLGVDLSGTLPDGLVPVGEGFASGDTAQNQGDTIFFNYGRCHAYTQLWAGSPADFAAVAIVSETSRVVTVRGTRGLLAEISPSTWALLWPEEPGIDVRLQGNDCDLTSIATGLRVVDQTTWQSKMSSLGTQAHVFTPQAPTTSPALPGPGTYGLAH